MVLYTLEILNNYRPSIFNHGYGAVYLRQFSSWDTSVREDHRCELIYQVPNKQYPEKRVMS